MSAARRPPAPPRRALTEQPPKKFESDEWYRPQKAPVGVRLLGRPVIRRIYIAWMRHRGRHVLAADCWCHPTVTSYRQSLS